MALACKISELLEHLRQQQHDDFVLCSLWYEDDIRAVDDSSTTEEAKAALRHAADNHDAEQGIHWGTLEASLDAVRHTSGG